MEKPIDAEFWAQRAADAKKVARSMRNPMAQRAMERLASNYEAFARETADRGAKVAVETADQ